MFRHSFQGGLSVEIFSGQGKDPVAKWKLYGGPLAIHKEFNNEVKGFVYCLEGSSQTVKMQMPANGKTSLGLLQRILVLQVYVPLKEDFSIELTITDSEHLKKRLHISTVHKEVSANQLHAKIPFAGLKRNIWSTLCIDLVSFAENLFKGFLTLDIITLCATCKVRRIFTMRTDPTGMTDDDMFLNEDGFMDLIPRNCHFPPHVNHVTQVLSVENLQKMEMSARMLISDCQVPDQSASARTTSYGRTKPQGVLRSASGSKVSKPSLQTGKKSSTVLDGVNERALPIPNTGSKGGRQKVAAESQSSASLSENVLHGKPSHIDLKETSGSSQPHSPKDKEFDKPGPRKPQVLFSSGKERIALSDCVPGSHRKKSNTKEKCTPPSSREEIRQQPLNQRTQQSMSDSVLLGDCTNSPSQQNSGASPANAECLTWPDLPCDLQENDEGSEPQLVLKDDEPSPRLAESGGYDLHSLSRLQLHDDEELQMLASLKRQQEEDECRASGLSASQIQHCNVSISMNSEDTPTWTHSSTPADQGHHYQKEMNPLQQSNPRDWMDVLSPPINLPSQQRRSGKMWNNPDNPVEGGFEAVNEEENGDESLNLFYDPCLNCYFDPETGKYYELA
ncbi:protein CFAP20DC [Antennarius striatus]|uniref:protein CFAP20DC n=1 Tax=Antennarius striatus TaxID=241820 RepID=UPI0035AFE171